MQNKENRGGARPGAGRKSANPQKKRVQMVITVDPETRDALNFLYRYRAIRPGRAVDYLVKNFYNEI